MRVEIRTRIEENKPAVTVTANETLYHPSHFDERISALRAAQKWLRTELARATVKK